VTTLDNVANVPEFDYQPASHAGIYGLGFSTGQVYALQLGDGRYAAIEFTEFNTPMAMPGWTLCRFNYKYQTNGTPSFVAP
jgi:hypothetical protein